MTSRRAGALELCERAEVGRNDLLPSSLADDRGKAVVSLDYWTFWLLLKCIQEELAWIKWLDLFLYFCYHELKQISHKAEHTTFLFSNFIFYNWLHILGCTLARTIHLKKGNVNWNSVQQGRTLLPTPKQIRQEMKRNEVDVHEIHKKSDGAHSRGRVAGAPSEVLEMCCSLSVLF